MFPPTWPVFAASVKICLDVLPTDNKATRLRVLFALPMLLCYASISAGRECYAAFGVQT